MLSRHASASPQEAFIFVALAIERQRGNACTSRQLVDSSGHVDEREEEAEMQLTPYLIYLVMYIFYFWLFIQLFIYEPVGIQAPPGKARSMEDLKARYYTIARQLLTAREGAQEQVAHHTLVKHPFNAETERYAACDCPSHMLVDYWWDHSQTAIRSSPGADADVLHICLRHPSCSCLYKLIKGVLLAGLICIFPSTAAPFVHCIPGGACLQQQCRISCPLLQTHWQAQGSYGPRSARSFPQL